MIRRASSGIVRDPMHTEILDGYEGGGGVRLHPPNLDEVVDASY